MGGGLFCPPALRVLTFTPREFHIHLEITKEWPKYTRFHLMKGPQMVKEESYHMPLNILCSVLFAASLRNLLTTA